MKFLILLAIVGACCALPQFPTQQAVIAQRPVEIADVGKATAEFFRAYQAAVAANVPQLTQAARPSAHHAHAPQTHFRQPAPTFQPRWTGPVAATVPAGLAGSSPVVGDTPEVQAAKAAFARAFVHQLRSVSGRV